jgi:HSP20 family molecular chaperone IbpA
MSTKFINNWTNNPNKLTLESILDYYPLNSKTKNTFYSSYTWEYDSISNVYFIEIKMSGFSKTNTKVDIIDQYEGIISISSSRKGKTSEYSFAEKVLLPESVDLKTLKATMEDGLLTLTISPKSSSKNKESINIEIG